MANGFLAVYAVQHFQLADSVAGIFTGILYGASMLGNGVWGPLGDRWGNKRVMELSTWLWIAALGLALFAPTVWVFYAVFALVGVANAGGVLADFNIALEFGPEAERPTYIGLARTVTAPAVFIAPLIGGWIAQTWDYASVFVVAAVFSLVGQVLLIVQVQEPRHTSG
jgi:MFS family permease